MDEQVLQQLQTELKGFIARKDEEMKNIGSVTTETKNSITEIIRRIDGLEVQMARPSDSGPVSMSEELKAAPGLSAMIGVKKKGSASFELSPRSTREIIERKTLSSAGLGFPTYGVMPAERDGGIVAMARPQLRMLDVIPTRATTLGEIYFVKESARPAIASPIVEYTGLKPTIEPTFTTDKETVETIAAIMIASNQVLADFTELEGFLRGELAARVAQELDRQLLWGSGTSPDLHGLTQQAQAWDLTLLTASDGYEYHDMIAGALQQIAEDDELQEQQFAVLHPGDAWKIRRLKDSTGRYLWGDPSGFTSVLNIFGAPVVETTQMTKGKFLVGSGSPLASEYRSRQTLTIELSTEDSTNFRYNLVTIRAELRGALITKMPNAFVYGDLTQSPA